MFDFLKRYVKNPSKIGAIAPSGQGLTMKMMEPVDFENAKCKYDNRVQCNYDCKII